MNYLLLLWFFSNSWVSLVKVIKSSLIFFLITSLKHISLKVLLHFLNEITFTYGFVKTGRNINLTLITNNLMILPYRKWNISLNMYILYYFCFLFYYIWVFGLFHLWIWIVECASNLDANLCGLRDQFTVIAPLNHYFYCPRNKMKLNS